VTKIGELGTTQAATSNRRTLRRNTKWYFFAACVVPSSPIFITLMKEAPGSSETSVLTRATWRNNPEDTILHSHRRENLKSYIVVNCLTVAIMSCLCALSDERSGLSFVSHSPVMVNMYMNYSQFSCFTGIIYTIYTQAHVSPGSVQQIMPCRLS
jgi:hypothetical protein